MTTATRTIPGPRTQPDTLIELAGYLVDLRRAEQAEDAATCAALQLDVAASALHAALEPVTDAVKWHIPAWRYVDHGRTPGEAALLPTSRISSHLAPSVLARLQDAPARLLEILADVDAATAAMHRLVEDIDEDQAAAHTRIQHDHADSHADEDDEELRADDADSYDSEAGNPW